MRFRRAISVCRAMGLKNLRELEERARRGVPGGHTAHVSMEDRSQGAVRGTSHLRDPTMKMEQLRRSRSIVL